MKDKVKTVQIVYWDRTERKDEWFKDITGIDYQGSYVVIYGDEWTKIVPLTENIKEIVVID